MHYRILCLLQLWLQLFFLKQKVGKVDYLVISDLEHSPNLQTYFVTGLLRA